MTNIVEIRDLKKQYGSVKALDDINLDIKSGEVLGIAGESGSGKTTLGRLIINLIKPEAGTIKYNNNDIFSLSKEDLKIFRSSVQMVFQNPYTSLNPRMKIRSILDEPLRIIGMIDKIKRSNKIDDLLNIVGLDMGFAEKYPHELSGGERQRIGIARALSVKPKLLILDEPVSSLDVSIQAQVLNLLKEIKKKNDLTYVFISHDLSVIKYLCDRVVVLENGRLVEIGNCDDVFNSPKTSYVKKLISSIPSLSQH